MENADLQVLLRTYEHMGGTPYPARNLLAVILYGTVDGVTAPEELEDHCIYDARYRFLMGGLEPDERTFRRFIERIDSHADELFTTFMQQLRGANHGRSNVVIVDGTKKAGNASWWKYTKDSKEPHSDPDARLQNSHGRRLVGYNAQVALDLESKMILACDVFSDQSDQHVGERLMETMKLQQGSYPCAVVADTGFDTNENIAAMESRGIDSVIFPGDNLPAQLGEDGEGVLVCPAGRRLIKLRQEFKSTTGWTYDVYRPEGGCSKCPLSTTCSFKGKRLCVKEGTDPGTRFRNRERFNSATYAWARTKRRWVETPFAQMWLDGFTRFRRRGRNKVRTELILWAITYNMRVAAALLAHFWSRYSAFLHICQLKSC